LGRKQALQLGEDGRAVALGGGAVGEVGGDHESAAAVAKRGSDLLSGR
jgi:hypothetical protein